MSTQMHAEGEPMGTPHLTSPISPPSSPATLAHCPQALSKANWGASSTLLRDIAQATFHQ